jgi:SAM-dependent methyltransferase
MKKPRKREYQLGYSEYFADYQYDPKRQAHKAGKVRSVLADYFGGQKRLKDLSLLDIGCSTGLMTGEYAGLFGSVIGVDIDEPAIMHAKSTAANPNTLFFISDGANIGVGDKTFDVIICAHIYEHVPDYNSLMREIHRTLKDNGVCFFAAQNRLTFIEPHYFLPFLSILPKPLANLYMRAFGKGDSYYENLLWHWQLKRLVSDFEIHDYTKHVVARPEEFSATDVVRPGAISQKLGLFLLDRAYFLCPTYIWILKKKAIPK